MKVEAWVLGVTAAFNGLVSPAYWFITDSASKCGREECADWTGTSALVMTTLLAAMVTLYLVSHANKMDARPEDRKDGEMADGAGELGFFPPYSWWPLWCASSLALFAFGIAVLAWWLVIIAFTLGMMAVIGWVFEYYRGDFAH